ncbi:MAG: peptide ABC transporter substrate-binding protein [Anaerolineales bacterium]|nr:peptide ABC transporter substrate-binding protein [Anaerolineales bacterium]MCB0017150.1 peptide ABC transporter substrate-binding protein [Anaerolineales bacterium]
MKSLKKLLFILLGVMAFAACTPETVVEQVEVTRVVTETEQVVEQVEVTRVVVEEVVDTEIVESEPEIIVETQRGQGGQLTMIFWQAPSNQFPFLSGGTKEYLSSSMVLEPLADYNPQGQLYPVLVDEVPTLENGGFAEDLMSITWKLKEGLLWSDGTPVTSEDVIFTYEFCSDPDTGCAVSDNYAGIDSIEAVDDLTVVINFSEATPFPYKAFVASGNGLIQKAQWESCIGAAAVSCSDEAFYPIGTGPYVVSDFRPNDSILYEINPNYRNPQKPYFESIFLKGGGDAESAARAALETGESDFSWNLQVAPEVIAQMELGGQGFVSSAFGNSLERIMINFTNPSPDLPAEERGEYLDGNNPHPTLQLFEIRQALSMAIDRTTLTSFGYGTAFGIPTCNIIYNPAPYSSQNNTCEQDIEGANALLDEAGVVDSDGDGIREYNGIPLSYVFQTSTNAVRQGYQSFIKQWWAEIGVDTELRNIDASVYFGGDVASDDTYTKFFTDVEMYTSGPNGLDFGTHLADYTCARINGADNNWFGGNVTRYCSEEFDALIAEFNAEGDTARRQELVIAMNDHLVQNYVMIPLTGRGSVNACSNRVIGCRSNAWSNSLQNIADWTEASDQ